MQPEEVADVIESFLDGTCGRWDWDDFISVPLSNSQLNEIRVRCAGLPDRFPPTEAGYYCGPEGFEVMRALVRELRARSV